MIVSISGRKGCGKDTVAQHLVRLHGYTQYSWAGAVKDCLAAIFSWDRTLLEGHTAESRAWRETVDSWWAGRLGIPHFTPRWAMQHYATDVMRGHFHPDIWVASLERRLQMPKPYRNIVISDSRFTNELDAVLRLGGVNWCVHRDMIESDAHSSELQWRSYNFHSHIYNNGTLDELYSSVNDLLADHHAAR